MLVDPEFMSIPVPPSNVCSVATITEKYIAGFSDTCSIVKLTPERVNELTALTSKEHIISEIESIFVVASYVDSHDILARILENRLFLLDRWYSHWVDHWHRLKDVNENFRLKHAELVRERAKLLEFIKIFSDFSIVFKEEEPSKLGLLGRTTIRGYKEAFQKSIVNLSGDMIPTLPVYVPSAEVVMPQLHIEDPELPASLKEPLVYVSQLTPEKIAEHLSNSKQFSNQLMLLQLELSNDCNHILSFGNRALDSTENSKVLHQLFWNRITMLQAVYANLLLNAKDLRPEQAAEAKYYYDRLSLFRQFAGEDEMKYFHPIVFYKDFPFMIRNYSNSDKARLNFSEQLYLLFESIWFLPKR